MVPAWVMNKNWNSVWIVQNSLKSDISKHIPKLDVEMTAAKLRSTKKIKFLMFVARFSQVPVYLRTKNKFQKRRKGWLKSRANWQRNDTWSVFLRELLQHHCANSRVHEHKRNVTVSTPWASLTRDMQTWKSWKMERWWGKTKLSTWRV